MMTIVGETVTSFFRIHFLLYVLSLFLFLFGVCFCLCFVFLFLLFCYSFCFITGVVEPCARRPSPSDHQRTSYLLWIDLNKLTICLVFSRKMQGIGSKKRICGCFEDCILDAERVQTQSGQALMVCCALREIFDWANRVVPVAVCGIGS